MSSTCEFKTTQKQPDGNTYDIYIGPSRRAALEFLRQKSVTEERRYLVVETPEGNFGKDFIMIFDEATTEMIELGQRPKLKNPSPSMASCSTCSHPALPAKRQSGRVNYEFTIVSEMKKHGGGFVCNSCKGIICAMCIADGNDPKCPFCQSKLDVYKT